MRLSDSGESRVRGYLFVFERSLRTFLQRDIASDAVREVESHIREAVDLSDGSPNERDALERLLDHLGTPSQVAQAYSLELVVDEAAATGRIGAVARALVRVSATGVLSMLATLALFTGYAVGAGFVIVAGLKPIAPGNVGLWMRDGVPQSFGAAFPATPGLELVGGYWVIPFSLVAGGALLFVTHRLARRWLAWVKVHVLSPSLPS